MIDTLLISKSRKSNLRTLSHNDFLFPDRRQGVLNLKGDYVNLGADDQLDTTRF